MDNIKVVGVTGGTVETLNIAGTVIDKEEPVKKKDGKCSPGSDDGKNFKMPKFNIQVTGVSGGTVGEANVAGVVHGGMGNTTVNHGGRF